MDRPVPYSTGAESHLPFYLPHQARFGYLDVIAERAGLEPTGHLTAPKGLAIPCSTNYAYLSVKEGFHRWPAGFHPFVLVAGKQHTFREPANYRIRSATDLILLAIYR